MQWNVAWRRWTLTALFYWVCGPRWTLRDAAERGAGGESGIEPTRTSRYTRFPSVRLEPLGHLSRESFERRHHLNLTYQHRPEVPVSVSAARSANVMRDARPDALFQITAARGLKRELRARLILSIPVVLYGWMAMAIVDTIMVGRLNPEAIGAVGISSAIYYAPALFGLGALLGLDTLVAQAYGRGDFDECHHHARARRLYGAGLSLLSL